MKPIRKKTRFQIIIFLACFFVLFALTSVVLADPPDVDLENPLGTSDALKDPRIIVGNIIKVALGLVGAVALAMIILGGYMWLFSGGNQEKVKKGLNTLVWAAVGLFVIFASYAVVSWVLKQLTDL